MEKICPKCLFSGNPKYKASNPSRLFLGGLILGFGIIFISLGDFPTSFVDIPVLLVFIDIVILSTALYLILTYYSMARNLCSKCANEQMLDLNSLEAKELIKQYDLKEKDNVGLNTVNKKICINCNHIGQETRTEYFFVVGPIVLIILTFGFYMNSDLFENQSLGILGLAIWLLFSIYTLIIFTDSKEQCPKCNKKKTMIPLDTPKAEQLIKENNLSIPEETSKESSPQST